MIKKFYAMDSKETIDKITGVYQANGINIKKLNKRDLIYLIK